MSEISRRRIRSVSKLIRVGRIQTPVVLRVNREKGFIDLSKRRVDQTPEEKQAYSNKYNKAKALNSIIGHMSHTTGVDMEDLYKMFGWGMLRMYTQGKDPFKLALDPEKFYEAFPDVPEDLRPILNKNMQKRLTPQVVKIRAELECKCFKAEGIDAIKAAFKEALKLSQEGIELKITLVSPPLYIIASNTLLKDEGIALMSDAINVIEEHLTSKGGTLKIKSEPAVVSEDDP